MTAPADAPVSRLHGRVALVTGGGRGIGRAISVALARDGAAVAVNYATDRPSAEGTVDEIMAAGGTAEACAADVSDRQAVERMVHLVSENLGPVDILVNNAAIYPRTPFAEITDEEWDRVFAVNVRGAFVAAQVVAPSMAARGYGRIINLSSVTFLLGIGTYAHYIATKGALVGLTRALSRELGGSGITVNTVTPGAIETDREIADFPDRAALAEWVAARQALPGRLGPETVAAAVAFLASPEGGGITGQTLVVDGGWALH